MTQKFISIIVFGTLCFGACIGKKFVDESVKEVVTSEMFTGMSSAIEDKDGSPCNRDECSVKDAPRFVPRSCAKNYLPCNSTGKCIPASWKCDVWNDCEDGEDEQGCPGSSQFCPI